MKTVTGYWGFDVILMIAIFDKNRLNKIRIDFIFIEYSFQQKTNNAEKFSFVHKQGTSDDLYNFQDIVIVISHF